MPQSSLRRIAAIGLPSAILIGIALHCSSIAVLSAWGAYLTGVGTIGLVAAGLYAALKAIEELRYRTVEQESRTKLQKAEWLNRLFQQFYTSGDFKEIRRRIDYAQFDDLSRLIRRDKDGVPIDNRDDQELFDAFTDYLNFLEFVAYLKKLDQLNERDIKALFLYYLERINDTEAKIVKDYIDDPRSGFENLRDILGTLPGKGQRSGGKDK